MKFRSYATTAAGLVAITLFGWSCDWTGGSSDDFNTSGGSTTVNVSGFYSGVLNSGLAVSNTSGGNITSLTLQQSGNSLSVADSNGQNYGGSVGSPLTLASPDDLGLIPTGAQLASFQVSWAGKDGVAQRDVSFSGVISVVTIASIQGDLSTTTRVADSAESSANTSDVAVIGDNTATTSNTSNLDTTNQRNVNSTTGDSRNASTTTTLDTTETTQPQMGGNNQGLPTTEASNSSVVRTTTDASQSANQAINVNDRTATGNQNAVASTARTTTDNSLANNASSRGTTVNTTTTTQNDFTLTDANTQYRLRGNWVENGGASATVDAVAAGAGGFVSTFTTTP